VIHAIKVITKRRSVYPAMEQTYQRILAAVTGIADIA
jgi:hypothetical protein